MTPIFRHSRAARERGRRRQRPVHAFQRRERAACEPEGAVIRCQAEVVLEDQGQEGELGVGVAGALALDRDQAVLDPAQSLPQ